MTRMSFFIPALVLTGAVCASAQEASRPEPTHEKFTIATEPGPVTARSIRRLFGDRAVVDASAAISWRAYKQGQARFEFTDLADSRIAIGTQLLWQDLTQLNYFGNGPDSSIALYCRGSVW